MKEIIPTSFININKTQLSKEEEEKALELFDICMN